MKQQLLQLVLGLVTAVTAAQAHFVFVVPDAGGSSAKVFLSEGLEEDGAVAVELVAGAKLTLRTMDGEEHSLEKTKAGNAFQMALPGSGTRVIHGVVDLGFTESGDAAAKPYVLIYYPKTILGDAFDASTRLGATAPVELVPVGKAGAMKLRLEAHGKPVANSEVTVILPDGSEKKIVTDAAGETPPLEQTGRYGAWARFWEPASGERDGKKYEEQRNYATLVFHAGSGATKFATMPEAAASFGAVASGGWLYIYGGHIAKTHSYSTDAVSGKFARLNLSAPGSGWETLAGGPAQQGMNLAAHDGKIYRIGGMEPHNEPGKAANNYSVADCARFDPRTGEWEALPPLPKPRSSHDVVAIGSKLIVAGGWDMRGEAGQDWAETILTLDLSAANPKWQASPQPFQRRALIAAAFEGKVYVLGGIDAEGSVQPEVDIYDPESGKWSKGPALPGSGIDAFAPAAVVHHGALYASVANGKLYRLDEAGKQWRLAGSATGRVAHRLASHGEEILVIGGAADGKNFDLIEAVRVE